MHSKFWLPLALVVAAALMAALILGYLDTGPLPDARDPGPSTAAAPESKRDTPVRRSISGPDTAVSVAAAPKSTAPAPPPSADAVRLALAADTANNEEAKSQVLTLIEDAYASYDKGALRTLTPLLNHGDPAIREAAIEGFVQLGEPSGAKILRDAARRARRPKESALMIEAAEFLEIPAQPADAQ